MPPAGDIPDGARHCGRLPTAICGAPNAGKSSLYNRLVGRDAAIVTAVAGTTRDVLSETVPLGRVTLRLSDTAGLRESADEVERIGVSRALAALGAAELVLWIADPTAPAEAEADGAAETVAAAEASGKAVIRIRTRADLLPHPLPTGDGWLYISTVTGEGMDALREEVERLFMTAHCARARTPLCSVPGRRRRFRTVPMHFAALPGALPPG